MPSPRIEGSDNGGVKYVVELGIGRSTMGLEAVSIRSHALTCISELVINSDGTYVFCTQLGSFFFLHSARHNFKVDFQSMKL